MAIIGSFCFFILLMVLVGSIFSFRSKGGADSYLMAGRCHGKFMIALSGAASAASGFVMIGAVGMGYTSGLLAVLMPMAWFFGDYLFWTFFPDRINRRSREIESGTIPEFLGVMVTGASNSSIRKVFAIISIVFVGLYAVGQFLAAGKAVNAVFDISLVWAIILSGIVILAYSAKGGLQSSIPTQFVQAIIMLFTTIGMFVVALVMAGGPAQVLADLHAIDPDLLSLDGGRGYLLLLMSLLGFAATAFSFDIGQPQLLVRIMATRSPEEAAKARWIYLGFMQATWIAMAMFGIMMRVFFPDIDDPEQALPLFAKENLNPIFAGAVMAGIFAAVASTLDAQILVVSSSLGVDLSPDFFEKMTAKYGSRYQTLVTIGVAAVMAVAAIGLLGSTTVFTIIVFSASALGVTVGCTMLVAVMGWNTSVSAVMGATVVALLVAFVWRGSGLDAYLLEACPAFLAGLLAHWVLVRTSS